MAPLSDFEDEAPASPSGYVTDQPEENDRLVQLRITCDDHRHWWWPSPKPGQRCLCGRSAWTD